MARSRRKLIGSTLAVAVFLSVGCAQAKAETWVDAFARCAPGAKLDDCVAGLKKVGLTPEVQKNAGRRHAVLDLKEPYVWVWFDTDERQPKAAGRIVQVQMVSKLAPGKKERHELVSWLAEHLKGATGSGSIDSGSGYHCGAADSGPAWGPNADTPEVQVSLSTVTWLKPPAGKSPTTLFETGKSDQMSMCFMLPLNESSDDYVQPKYGSVYTEFLKSPLFASKTQPAVAAK
jgi:hypothetical protein